MNYKEINGRTLAYLGDAVWSLKVRKMLIEKGLQKGDKLQKETISYVSAKAQCALYEALHEVQFWSEEEEQVFKRGRNEHSGTLPKNTSAQVYRMSTGFEAIIGFLELTGNVDRIDVILQKVNEVKEVNHGTMDVREANG